MSVLSIGKKAYCTLIKVLVTLENVSELPAELPVLHCFLDREGWLVLLCQHVKVLVQEEE